MLKELTRRPTAINSFLIILLSLGVALVIGVHLGSAPLTFQDMITLGALVSVAIIFLMKRGLEIGFFIWIMIFALGYRVIRIPSPLILDIWGSNGGLSQTYITTGSPPVLQIQPLFLVIFLLLGLLLVQGAVNKQIRIVWMLPALLLAFIPFWVWGWLRASENNALWTDVLYEVMPFLMLPAVFIVTPTVLQKQSLWKPTIVAFFVVASIIAFFGLLELLYPNSIHMIPGLASADSSSSYISQDGFQRALFTFWGQPGAAFIVALATPLIIPLWAWYKGRGQRVLLSIGFVLQIIGIYIAGWRSLWLVMILITIGLLLLRGNWIRAIAFVLILTVAYGFLPAQTQKRAETLLSAIQGNFEDNSTIDRAGRSEFAVQMIEKNPMGWGWSLAGWVHDDYLQIAADLGVIPAIIYTLWYLTTLIRISRLFYESPDPLKHGLVGAFMIAGALMLTQPMIILPQYIAPVWLVWALVETKLRQSAEQRGTYSAITANGAYTDLQLTSTSAGMPGIGEMGR